jgi:hypothetical protein
LQPQADYHAWKLQKGQYLYLVNKEAETSSLIDLERCCGETSPIQITHKGIACPFPFTGTNAPSPNTLTTLSARSQVR